MDLGLAGRTALVLGGSAGLGLATARGLAVEGAQVVLAARGGDRLKAAEAALRPAGTAQPVDLADPRDVARFAAVAADLAPDILIANTGGPPPSSALDGPLEDWRRFAEPLLFSQIRIIQAVVPAMRDRGWGRVVVFASSGVEVPIPGLAISNGLRAALVSFAKTLAAEVAGSGVTVNALLPGRIATERVATLDAAAAGRQGLDVEEVRRRSREAIPAGRYGEPEEFAAAALFLCSTRASYVTGHMMRADGGYIRSL